AEVDEPGVSGFVLGELVGGVNDDTPRPVRHLAGQPGNLNEGDGNNHQVGVGRLGYGASRGALAQFVDQLAQCVRAATVAEHDSNSSRQGPCGDGPSYDSDPMIPILANKMC